MENIFSPLNTISFIRSKELNQKNIKQNSYLVKTKKINNIIKDKFDFLNIDIEGMDFEVMKSINLTFYNPRLICIEILNKKKFIKIRKYLKKYDFVYIKKLGPSFFFSIKSKKTFTTKQSLKRLKKP